jgi:NADH dehydrogenase FAD-containing subunit
VNKRILIPGGGFAGGYTALHLEKRLAGVPDVRRQKSAHRAAGPMLTVAVAVESGTLEPSESRQ